jgi:CRISPR/Cas system-associated exonuclease Cas4 (RecB family)
MINVDKSIAMYQAIADSNEERVFEMWHASSIANCPRNHYFKRLGIPALTKATGAKVLRWQAGHHFETAIRPIIASVYGETGTNERMTSKKLQLTGEFDNFVVKDNRLVEIKTVHDFAFIERDGQISLKEQVGTYPNGNKKWEAKTTPYLNHELQNHAYVLLLKEKGVEITHIDYVYISLSGRLVVYTTEVQESLLENVRRRLEALNTAWETKTPPDCICKEGHPLWDTTMRWCEYQTENDCCNLKLMEKK